MGHIGTETMRTMAREMVNGLASEGWSDQQKGAVMRIFTKVMAKHIRVISIDIAEFHEKFGLAYSGPPRELPPDVYQFRSKFMREELDEYDRAYAEHNLHDQFDALIDLGYVMFGTVHLQGLPYAAGWSIVHAANMAKVRAQRAEDSARSSTFDVVKPPGWVKPDLSPLLPALNPPDEPRLL